MRSEQDGTPRCAQNRNPYAMAWPKLRNAAVALTPTTPWQALAGGNAQGRGRRNRCYWRRCDPRSGGRVTDW